MKSQSFAAVICLFSIAVITPPLMGQEQPPARQEAMPPVEANYDEELMLWSLGQQTWEFAEVAAAYLPAKGSFNPMTREAVWTLQLAKDLTPGEVGLQSTIEGSPFKAMFLDEDKTLVLADAPIKITPITGKLGDAIRVTIRMPDEEILAVVALIRLERRTQVGF
jgi:hypothetical protein